MDTIDNVQMTEQNKQDLVDYLSNVAYLIIDIKKKPFIRSYLKLGINKQLCSRKKYKNDLLE